MYIFVQISVLKFQSTVLSLSMSYVRADEAVQRWSNPGSSLGKQGGQLMCPSKNFFYITEVYNWWTQSMYFLLSASFS